ncbi:MAG: ABC transporter substrate-binding protein [Synergistaceae bacterium]|jgi:polar amino acid transport system substrate-binding protein|nr:ABC transporter substrate-binding protein [Synergistaceae bacterium]
MKKVSKLCAGLCVASLLVVLAASCAFAAPADALKGKTLRLAINATFAPFESATQGGGFEGLDIDIVNRLAEKLGFKLDISDMEFAGLVGALTSGRADFVISGISPTPERLERLDASSSYFYPTIAIISRKAAPYPTIESLNGRKVAVPFGTSYEKRAETFPGVTVSPINGTPAVVQELRNTRVDAAVLDGCQAAVFAGMYPELEFHLLPLEMTRETSYAILFPKGSELREPIDAALKEIVDSGELYKMIEKWMGAAYLADYRERITQSKGK